MKKIIGILFLFAFLGLRAQRIYYTKEERNNAQDFTYANSISSILFIKT
jgi:hypothetical protein